MKVLHSFGIVTLLIGFSLTQAVKAENSLQEDELEIRKVFQEFTSAIELDRGEELYRLFSQESKGYWESIRYAALYYSEKQVKHTAPTPRMHIVFARASNSTESLINGDGYMLYKQMLSQYLSSVGEQSAEESVESKILNIEIGQSLATLTSARKGSPDSVRYHQFFKEGSTWRLNYMPILYDFNSILGILNTGSNSNSGVNNALNEAMIIMAKESSGEETNRSI